jgi:hypothetical protein
MGRVATARGSDVELCSWSYAAEADGDDVVERRVQR